MARQLMAEDDDDEDSRDDNLTQTSEHAAGEKSKASDDPTPMETESRE